jgi:acyl-CoA thioester hydrolase
MARPHEPFFWRVRVYWEDTDAGGVVYYANYLRFLERARTEWLRALGVDQGRLLNEDARQFAIVDLAIRYRRPARYGDLLAVSVVYAEHSRATMSLNQEIRLEDSGELLVEARVRAACLDARTLKPRPFPAILLEEIAT